MIQLADIADFVADLQGDVSEPSRTLIAKRLASLIGKSLSENHEEYRAWMEKNCRLFYAHCKLTCPERWVPDNLKVSETALSSFCNRWMSVAQFKLKDDTEWKYISPELNGLRVTMIEELQALSKVTT